MILIAIIALLCGYKDVAFFVAMMCFVLLATGVKL